jgi:hypothetical protein
MVSISNYSVNDFHCTSEGIVRILSVRDGELFLDVINLNYANAQSKGSADDEKLLHSNYYDSPFKCLDF